MVLFNKASRCEKLVYPEGTEIIAKKSNVREDIPTFKFTVIEMIPRQEKPMSLDNAPTGFFDHLKYWDKDEKDFDYRDDTLSVDLESVSVYDVDRIGGSTVPKLVTRERRLKVKRTM